MPTPTNSFKVLSVEGMPQKAPVARQQAPTKLGGQSNGTSAATVADLNARPVAKLHVKIDGGSTGRPFQGPVDEKGNEDKLNDLNTELLKESKTGQVYVQPEPHSVSRGPVYDKDILIRKRPPSEYTRAKPGR